MVSRKGWNYERDIMHCEVSPYVTVERIECINEVGLNTLVSVNFVGSNYRALVGRELYDVGDSVVFIPDGEVIPYEMSEHLGITKYLSKGKVKASRLGGVMSYGIVVDVETFEAFSGSIYHWEDVPNVSMHGNARPAREIPKWFPEFPSIPNYIRGVPEIPSECKLFMSEKIHGTNCRFGKHINPSTGLEELVVGSHHIVLTDQNNVYSRAVLKALDNQWEKLPLGVTFYCEVFGKGIQDLDYNQFEAIRVFAAQDSKGWWHTCYLNQICDDLYIPRVPVLLVNNISYDAWEVLATEPSAYTSKHIKEGIVISFERTQGDAMYCREKYWAKIINPEYRLRKGGTERK